MIHFKKVISIIIFFILGACSSIPKNTQNSCAIFEERYLGKCLKGKINLNRWMVRNGYAIAYRKYSKLYILDENYAKEEKLGMWKGSFMKPEKWRKLN